MSILKPNFTINHCGSDLATNSQLERGAGTVSHANHRNLRGFICRLDDTRIDKSVNMGTGLVPNEKTTEQSVPGYAAQGASSPEP